MKRINFKPIPDDSWLHNIQKGDPWCVGFRHFLKKKEIPGFIEKASEFIGNSSIKPNCNRGNFAMWSTLAELDSLIIAENLLRGNVSGFNVKKTKSSKSKNCDFSVKTHQYEYRCEVKRISKEQNYSFPMTLEVAILKEIKSTDFSAILKIKVKNPDFKTLIPSIKCKLRWHINLFKKEFEAGLLSSHRKDKGFPYSLIEKEFEIFFFMKENGKNSVLLEAFQPIKIEDVRKAIFVSDSGPSLIQQALDKGADILFVMIPGWFSKEEIASGVFAEKMMSDQVIFFPKIITDLEIKGICVFSRKDHFVLALNCSEDFGNIE